MTLDAIGNIVKVVGDVADDLITTKEEKMKAELDYYKIDADLLQGQLEINANEAQHKSMFVAGWRPFIGWVCGAALAYNFIVQPLLLFILQSVGTEVNPPPLEIESLMTLLFGM